MIPPAAIAEARASNGTAVSDRAGEPGVTLLAPSERLHRRLVRLACDIHDGPMQSLVAIGWGIGELKRELEQADTEAATQLAARVDALAAELIAAEAGLRTLIRRLEQAKPELETLEEILGGEIDAFQQRSGTRVQTEAPARFVPDSHSQALAIRAIVREALNNVAKHAQAESVAIRIEAGAAGVLIEVEDDGRGFDPASVREDALGLTNMKERAAMLDGELSVLSRPGGPTIVTARLERWQQPR